MDNMEYFLEKEKRFMELIKQKLSSFPAVSHARVRTRIFDGEIHFFVEVILKRKMTDKEVIRYNEVIDELSNEFAPSLVDVLDFEITTEANCYSSDIRRLYA